MLAPVALLEPNMFDPPLGAEVPKEKPPELFGGSLIVEARKDGIAIRFQ